MTARADWRYLDYWLLLVMLALVGVGLLMIYSSYELTAPAPPGDLWNNSVFRQAVFAAVGLVLYLIVASVDYHVFTTLWAWLYVLTLVSLAVTLSIGRISFGAQSWVGLQIMGVQPSELCKILMVWVLARTLGVDDQALESFRPFLVSVVLVAAPAALVYLQPDFGTAVILVLGWLGICFLAGVRWRHLLLLTALCIAAAPIAWLRLESYMRDRILMFVLPGYDPSGASYNVTQALISIGSGGWWGKGLFHGTQSQLHFLRVRHTDFIFSVWAEEFGFVGSLLLLAAFAILIMRIVRIALAARDPTGRAIAGGVATMILAQAIINLGMNANIMPVTGLPLPLVSYGGSSLLTTLLSLGAVQSVALRSRTPDFALI